jgi:hypothetical protein
LSFFGLSGINGVEKQEMVDLILRGGPWSIEEQRAILSYCEDDVLALQQLLSAMASYD